jgi:hypothetical protein
MEGSLTTAGEEAAAFQRIWLETISRTLQMGFTISPTTPPSELARQVRSGIFEGMANSWEHFMRSPQFLTTVRQWTENAIAFRKLSHDLMARVRTELQAPSRNDIDSIMMTVRHMEHRLLNRLDDLSAEIAQLKTESVPGLAHGKSPRAVRSKGRKGPRQAQAVREKGKATIP